MPSKFLDRYQAGQVLAEHLSQLPPVSAGLVLALPRGGVPIGYEIACRFKWPLDIWLVRKLGVPDQPELAMGAIAFPDARILNVDLIQRLAIAPEQVEAVTQAEKVELHRRDRLYRQGQPLPVIENSAIVLVDDGLATGATMQAAITALKSYQPASVTVAVPIAAPNNLQQIQAQVDQVVCPLQPKQMGSISQWYTHFDPVSDGEVMALLKQAQSIGIETES